MGNISILLVDDHVLVRESIRKLLEEEEGLEVIGEAGDGESAVKLARTLQPKVVIMDIGLPGLNGIEATKQIKELCPTTKVLILTAYDYEQYIFAILEAGATGYLLKDICGRELVKSTLAVGHGESVLHPAVAGKVMKRFREKSRSDTGHTGMLTSREKEVLWLAAKGLKNKEIAKQLFVCARTVEAHLGNIFTKLEVTSRTEAIMVGLKKGLINLHQVI